MITTWVMMAIIFLLGVLTLLAVIEMNLSRVNRISVRRLFEKHPSRTTEQLKLMVDGRLESMISVYVGIQLCMVFLAVIITAYLHSCFQSYLYALLASFFVMFLTVVLFRQLIPRLVTHRKPERLLLLLIPIYMLFKPALTVLAYPLASTLKLLDQRKGQEDEEKTEEHLEDEIQAFIDVGKEQGILKTDEEKLFQSVVEFGDTVAGDIMTPRTEMVTIEVTATLSQLKNLMTETKYSRIPVYQAQVENIIGIVYLKDVIDIWDQTDDGTTVEKLVRPILFVPETKSVGDLLKELQRQASHMAVVIDEFGGLAGLVTIEDILEEIAGEIHDEDEVSEMTQISQTAEGQFVVPGRTPIHTVEELLGIALEGGENTTIAGLLTSVMGRVPRKGEKYAHQGIQFEVKDADRRRVHHLLLAPAVPSRAVSTDPSKE
jgi:putative hemolysin